MKPNELKHSREALGLTQEQLAEKLNTTRMTITRYECGTHKIPGAVEMVVKQFTSSPHILMAGLVAAGDPIEPIPQTEFVEVPPSMRRDGKTFALKVKGESMRDEGILPGDLVIVQKQATARNGQTVIALLNQEATLKKFYRKQNRVELHPENSTMQPILVKSTDDFQIEGIVIGVIRHVQ